MGFFDIYRYTNEGLPMGRAALVRVEVTGPQRAEMERWLAEHGHPAGVEGARCWYCGKGEVAEPLGLVVQKGVAVQHLVTMTVPVPTCAACRATFVGRARAATRLHHVGFLAGLIGVIVVLVTQGQAPRDWIKAILVGLLVTLFVAGVVGSSLGWIAVRAGAAKTKGLRSELDYPPAKKVLEDGWRPMWSPGS